MSHNLARWLGAGLSEARRGLSGLWRLEARWKGVRFDGRATFVGRPLVSVAPDSVLEVGDNVQVSSSLRANPLGLFQPTVLRTLVPGARLVIASNTGVSGAVICAARSIEIGEGTIIGAGALIIDNDFHVHGPSGWTDDVQATAKAIKIGREVFVGTRAIILKGVTIGDRSTIGAGAVVTSDVPADHYAVGNPAQVYRKRQKNLS